MMREGRLPISSGGGMSEPRLPGGAGDREGFLGISGLGDFSCTTSILGAAGFSSGSLILGAAGAGGSSGALTSAIFGLSAGYKTANRDCVHYTICRHGLFYQNIFFNITLSFSGFSLVVGVGEIFSYFSRSGLS